MLSFRSIFLSDLHLGFKGCQTERLLDFLPAVRADHLFLLGDIVDIQVLRFRIHWPAICTDILKLLLQSSRTGTHVS